MHYLTQTHRLRMHNVGACTSSLCVCRKSPQTAANHQNRDLRELRKPQFSAATTCLKKKFLINILDSSPKIMLKTKKISLKKLPIALVILPLVIIIMTYMA